MGKYQEELVMGNLSLCRLGMVMLLCVKGSLMIIWKILIVYKFCSSTDTTCRSCARTTRPKFPATHPIKTVYWGRFSSMVEDAYEYGVFLQDGRRGCSPLNSFLLWCRAISLVSYNTLQENVTSNLEQFQESFLKRYSTSTNDFLDIIFWTWPKINSWRLYNAGS